MVVVVVDLKWNECTKVTTTTTTVSTLTKKEITICRVLVLPVLPHSLFTFTVKVAL